jgi:hypothetical protein
MLQREINPCSEERRREDQQHDLNIERHLVPWVEVHEYARCVAGALCETPEAQSDHVGPGFVADAIEEVDQKGEAEEACEDGVENEGGLVAVYRAFDGTEVGDVFATLGDFDAGRCTAHFER